MLLYKGYQALNELLGSVSWQGLRKRMLPVYTWLEAPQHNRLPYMFLLVAMFLLSKNVFVGFFVYSIVTMFFVWWLMEPELRYGRRGVAYGYDLRAIANDFRVICVLASPAAIFLTTDIGLNAEYILRLFGGILPAVFLVSGYAGYLDRYQPVPTD